MPNLLIAPEAWSKTSTAIRITRPTTEAPASPVTPWNRRSRTFRREPRVRPPPDEPAVGSTADTGRLGLHLLERLLGGREDHLGDRHEEQLRPERLTPGQSPEHHVAQLGRLVALERQDHVDERADRVGVLVLRGRVDDVHLVAARNGLDRARRCGDLLDAGRDVLTAG